MEPKKKGKVIQKHAKFSWNIFVRQLFKFLIVEIILQWLTLTFVTLQFSAKLRIPQGYIPAESLLWRIQ